MAEIAVPPPQETRNPSWRALLGYLFDVRVLGILGQMGFIVVVFLGARVIGGNFSQNARKLGKAQFICRDGSYSYLCAFDFMDSEAGFDISDTVLDYANTDSYWYAFYLGFLNTLKVGLLGVFLVTLVGTFAGIARLSSNWLISKIALGYVELMRNTPIIIQLFFLYFGVLLALPDVGEALQPFGFPIFLSNRGLNLPSPEFTTSASIWLAFLILGIIQFQVLWIFLGRQEERTGRPTNRLSASIFSFLIVVGIGWFVSSAVADSQGLLVTRGSRIRKLEDTKKIMLTRTGLNHLNDLDNLSAEEIDAAALQICVLRDSASEPNLTRQLRGMNIPYNVIRSDLPDQATEKYAEGTCEVFAASKSVLAAERSTLENLNSHLILPIQERPVVWSVPALEGFNIVGGSKLTPEFTALLFGLVLFYGGSLAEIVRAGIQSVSKGQTEAARALGLTEGHRLQLVILPQALRVIIPPLIGIFLSLAKDTSLGIAIGFPDMYRVSFTSMNQSGRTLQLFILMMLAYMLISLTFSIILNWYNERTKLVER